MTPIFQKKPKTVASVTAKLAQTVDELRAVEEAAIEAEGAALVRVQRAEAAAAEARDEAAKAARIAANIEALLS